MKKNRIKVVILVAIFSISSINGAEVDDAVSHQVRPTNIAFHCGLGVLTGVLSYQDNVSFCLTPVLPIGSAVSALRGPEKMRNLLVYGGAHASCAIMTYMVLARYEKFRQAQQDARELQNFNEKLQMMARRDEQQKRGMDSLRQKLEEIELLRKYGH